MEVITAGGLTTLLVELIKWLWRKYIVKDTTYDFPTIFYLVFLPVSNALMPFFMVWLGVQTTNPLAGMSLEEIAKYLVGIILASLISLVTYAVGVKPLKDKNKVMKAKKLEETKNVTA
jgi:hypothetical protein